MLGIEKQRVIAHLRLALPMHWKKACALMPPTLLGADAPCCSQSSTQLSPVSRQRAGALQEPDFIRICGAVLPVGNDFSCLPAAEVAAGLGCVLHLIPSCCTLMRFAWCPSSLLLHFTTLASRYLACPLLHEGSFRVRTWPVRYGVIDAAC